MTNTFDKIDLNKSYEVRNGLGGLFTMHKIKQISDGRFTGKIDHKGSDFHGKDMPFGLSDVVREA